MTRRPLLIPPVVSWRFSLRTLLFVAVLVSFLVIHPAATIALAVTMVIWWPGIMYTRLLLVKRHPGWRARLVFSVLVLLGVAIVTMVSMWLLVAALLDWLPLERSSPKFGIDSSP